MKRILIPIGVLAALGFATIVCCGIFIMTQKNKISVDTKASKTEHHTYEMPKLVPAVWLHGR